MKNIIVPTDFSATAEKAINFAVETAKIFPAKVTLVHSFEMFESFTSDYLGVNKEFTMNMLRDLEKQLEELKIEVQKKHKIEVEAIISTYTLREAILKTQEKKDGDLVVMGTEGASGLKEKIWGSRTASIIGSINIPIITIPDNYEWKKPSKILFLTNQFEKDPKILNAIFELANLYMANVLVGVFTDIEDENIDKFMENQQRISNYEVFIKENYKEEALVSEHIIGEDFEDSVQNFINENEIDMLIMITYHDEFWKRLFNASKTKKMSYHTQIPLMAIPVRR